MFPLNLFGQQITHAFQLGDSREPIRVRVSQIVQTLPKVYAYSQVFHLLLEHGLKSKVAKTRQGTLEELGGLLKRLGIGACEPAKAFPQIAACISDKDPNVRKSALATLRCVSSLRFLRWWANSSFQRGVRAGRREDLAAGWTAFSQGQDTVGGEAASRPWP